MKFSIDVLGIFLKIVIKSDGSAYSDYPEFSVIVHTPHLKTCPENVASATCKFYCNLAGSAPIAATAAPPSDTLANFRRKRGQLASGGDRDDSQSWTISALVNRDRTSDITYFREIKSLFCRIGIWQQENTSITVRVAKLVSPWQLNPRLGRLFLIFLIKIVYIYNINTFFVNKVTFAPLLVSALFILLTSLLAHCARKLVNRFVNEPFVKLLLEEAIASAELCGCCFELIIVADNFGVGTYAIFLFALTIWWTLNWGEATACPYTHLEDLIEGKTDLRKMLLRIWAELTGGLLVFKYVQMYWALEIAETHKDRAYEECKADLQVPMLYGAVVEGVATCMCRLASKAIGDLNPRFATAVDSFIGTSLVVAAFDYSGGYFNPVLATSLKFGCDGNTMLEHAVVYWIGASAGAVLSVYVYKMPAVQRMLGRSAEVNGDTIWGDKED